MYDVIIIGNDICSLTAATRAAQIGLKTALLSDKSLPDRFELSGYTFDIDPLPWPLINLANYPFFSGFSLNRPREIFETNIQVVFPEHRIDLVSGKYAQIKEVSRELPDLAKEINKVFDIMDEIHSICDSLIPALCSSRKCIQDSIRLIPKFFLQRFLWYIQIRKINISNVLKHFLNALIGTFSYHFPKGLPNADSGYLLSQAWKGSFYNGNKGHIRKEIRNSLLEYGGDILDGNSIKEVLLGKEIDIVLRESEGEIMVSGRNLIISTKSSALPKLEHDSDFMKWLDRKDKKRGLVFYPFTIHLGIAENSIPEMMKDYVILVPENFPLEGCGMILLNADSVDLKYAPAGKRALSATVFLPFSPLETEDDQLKHVGEIILNGIESLLPFLKENIDFLDFEMSIKLSRRSLEVVGSKMSASPGLIRSLMFPNERPKRNVMLTGGELYSELGFTGEVLSGIHAANRISGGKPNASK